MTIPLGRGSLVFVVALLLAACTETSFEASRVTSPDGALDAVVLESDQGATTAYTYTVCIVDRGRSCTNRAAVAQFYDASRSKAAFGVDTAWQSPHQLIVTYLRAREARRLLSKDSSAKAVDVRFQSGTQNEAARRGPMVQIHE